VSGDTALLILSLGIRWRGEHYTKTTLIPVEAPPAADEWEAAWTPEAERTLWG